jgi:transcription-repair coupling factor (superfamily II helicase)
LFAPPFSVLTPEARKRLKTIEEFSELGDGFQVAMRDMDIRGAGNLLGGEQSGFIADIGYETYQKILDEAIHELKETDFKDLFKEELTKKGDFVREVTVETDLEMRIPDEYVSNTQERLALYTQLNDITDEQGIEQFATMLTDRFGKIPTAVLTLFEALRLQWLCKRLGFERLILKGGKLRCYFLSKPQSPFFESDDFHKIISFVGKHGRQMSISMKQTNKEFILVQEGTRTIKQAKSLLEQLLGSL